MLAGTYRCGCKMVWKIGIKQWLAPLNIFIPWILPNRNESQNQDHFLGILQEYAGIWFEMQRFLWRFYTTVLNLNSSRNVLSSVVPDMLLRGIEDLWHISAQFQSIRKEPGIFFKNIFVIIIIIVWKNSLGHLFYLRDLL